VIPASRPRGIVWIQGDIADPPLGAIRQFAPETCLHAAWIATPGVYLESPANHDWVRWSDAFVQSLVSLGIQHVLALGTCIEYRPSPEPFSESISVVEPVSRYARCKVELHDRLGTLLAARSIPFTWARIFFPYGNGEHPARLASSVLADLRSGKPVNLRTPHSVRDYIHVDDVASALLALASKRPDSAVNVGTGNGVAVVDLARMLAALLGRDSLVDTAAGLPESPPDRIVADASRLRALGWHPKVALEVGLRWLVEATRR